MDALVTQLEGLYSKIRLGGTEKARQRHLSRGKLLPRERCVYSLDSATHEALLTPRLILCALALRA